MIKILIVDDHTMIREGLEKIIRQERDMIVVGMAGDAKHALKLFTETKPEIILLDISIPGISGLDLLKDLKRLDHRIGIIILSMFPEERFAIRAFKAGASAYLTKEMAVDEVVSAIRRVYSGQRYITPAVAELMADDYDKSVTLSLHESLSEREFDILCKIASGKSLKMIAEELYLSESTISTYRARIMKKMQMKNNAQIIHYGITNGLID
jgi:two-component system, NarL family, invasion response regulator UvrY